MSLDLSWAFQCAKETSDFMFNQMRPMFYMDIGAEYIWINKKELNGILYYIPYKSTPDLFYRIVSSIVLDFRVQ